LFGATSRPSGLRRSLGCSKIGAARTATRRGGAPWFVYAYVVKPGLAPLFGQLEGGPSSRRTRTPLPDHHSPARARRVEAARNERLDKVRKLLGWDK